MMSNICFVFTATYATCFVKYNAAACRSSLWIYRISWKQIHPLSKSPCLACLRCVLQEGVLFPPVHQGLFTRGAETCRNEVSTDQRFEHFEILQPERSTGSFHMLFFDLRSASEFSRQPKPTEWFKVFDQSRKKSKSRCLEKSPKTLDWIKQSMYVRHQQ